MAFLGQQLLIVGVSIAMLIIATLSEIFRFLSRYATHSGFWWDDWCSLVAMVGQYNTHHVGKSDQFLLDIVIFSQYRSVCL
jgi:hypothetical protein